MLLLVMRVSLARHAMLLLVSFALGSKRVRALRGAYHAAARPLGLSQGRAKKGKGGNVDGSAEDCDVILQNQTENQNDTSIL